MPRRDGYTLLELLLVLAIIAVLAAISAPALKGVMQRAQLTSAADTVRIELARAHVKAMKTGRIQVFYFEPSGRKYRVQPWIAGDDELERAGGEQGLAFSPPGELAMSPETDMGEEKELPEGTTFAAGEAAEESRGVAATEAVAAEGGGSQWSLPILFYPDGSSSDAFVVVADEFERGMRIDLSGLTGTAKIGPVAALETLIQ